MRGRFGFALSGPVKKIPLRGLASYEIRSSNSSPALRAFGRRIDRVSSWSSHSRLWPASSTTLRMFRSPASSATSVSPSLIGDRRWVTVPDTVRSRSSIVISSRTCWTRNVRSRGGCSGASGGAKSFGPSARPTRRHDSENSLTGNPRPNPVRGETVEAYLGLPRGETFRSRLIPLDRRSSYGPRRFSDGAMHEDRGREIAAIRHRSVRAVPSEIFVLVASDFLMLCYQPLRAAGFLERLKKATTGPA